MATSSQQRPLVPSRRGRGAEARPVTPCERPGHRPGPGHGYGSGHLGASRRREGRLKANMHKKSATEGFVQRFFRRSGPIISLHNVQLHVLVGMTWNVEKCMASRTSSYQKCFEGPWLYVNMLSHASPPSPELFYMCQRVLRPTEHQVNDLRPTPNPLSPTFPPVRCVPKRGHVDCSRDHGFQEVYR